MPQFDPNEHMIPYEIGTCMLVARNVVQQQPGHLLQSPLSFWSSTLRRNFHALLYKRTSMLPFSHARLAPDGSTCYVPRPQVSFRSDYLKLYQSQQVAMAELLFAKEQLTEVREGAEQHVY